MEETKYWLDQARNQQDKDIRTMPVSYELHPISTLRNFGTRKIPRTRYEQMMLARAKPIINEMAILHSALDYLKSKAPDIRCVYFSWQIFCIVEGMYCKNDILHADRVLKPMFSGFPGLMRIPNQENPKYLLLISDHGSESKISICSC